MNKLILSIIIAIICLIGCGNATQIDADNLRGDDGYEAKLDNKILNISDQFTPVVGLGYKYRINKTFGIGGFGLTNRTFGLILSWEN